MSVDPNHFRIFDWFMANAHYVPASPGHNYSCPFRDGFVQTASVFFKICQDIRDEHYPPKK